MAKFIRLQPSGKEITCAEDQTVLEALEHAGYALPNNCRAGACGECKTRVLSGTFDQGFVMDMALSRKDRAAGYGLMCMAKPTSAALELDYGTADAQPKLFPPRTGVPFVVVDKMARAPEVVELRLRPLGGRLRYWPGQHVMVGSTDPAHAERQYSMANAPRPDGEIVLLVGRHRGGETSTWIHDALAEGDVVAVSGPYGTFIGDVSLEAPVVCLAGGTGLAPILALTDGALRRGFSLPVTIVYSARRSAEVYERGLTAYWQRRYPNFHFVVTLTREAGGSGEYGGRIPDILPGLFPHLAPYQVFIAGSPGFVAACEAAALVCHALPERVFTEAYVPRAQPALPASERLMEPSAVG
ncbi:MAG: 2Fe-2S iron-sulfur cluster-binding protein [Actinomycetota bacterium]|jgi:CDP-4-dehydro-6-deoxyglucose reductase|nr:2Fe-2S iron-sulfur cluster-binding protein [Actinomycetota bacterium]